MQIENIVTDATTFTAVMAASGTSPATYVNRAAVNVSVAERLEISARPSASNEAKKIRLTLNVPYATVDATGVTRKSANILFSLDAVFPDIVPAARRNEAIALLQSVLYSPQVTNTFDSGFAPN